jgi:hypothetical protein
MKFISVFFLTITVIFAKNPAFILYDDGTWEKAGGGSYDLSSSSSSNSSMGSLEVIATLKMQRGGAEPAGSEDVYLITKSVAEMCRSRGLPASTKYSSGFINSYANAVQTASYIPEMVPYLNAVQEGLRNFMVGEDITDLGGKTEFHGIKPGKYYVLLSTSLGTKYGGAWCVPVVIKAGRNKIILRNENFNEDLFHEGESQITSPSPVSSTSFTPSPSISTLTYESERDAVLTRHRNKQITNEAAIQELKALKLKYGK